MSKVHELQAPLHAVIFLNETTAILELYAPEIADSAQPGQFVNLSCDRFLKRPIGIMSVDQSSGCITLGIQIKGEGTRWISQQKPGTIFSVLGPLGHGFNLDGFKRVITVGGGTGVFPLYFVQQICREKEIDSIAVCGYRSKEDSILRHEYAMLGCQTCFASECGDLTVNGRAADALRLLLDSAVQEPGTVILTCGPRPMMQAVAELAAAYQLPCQVSLEERMACGIGVCLVCACEMKTDSEQSSDRYKRCCVDGPVFNAEVVQW